jgi:outer membrane receptor protein involved in Fe transport
MPDILSFGKFRAGYASVGAGTSPYRLNTVYSANSNFGSNGTSTVPNAQLNPNLKPERTQGFELGLDLRLLKDRVGIDFTYYNNVTKDQIFNVSQSGATGFTSRSLNAGKVQNQGIEFMAYGTPVKTKDFQWDINFNLGKNNNKVLELYTGTDNIRLTSLFGVALDARVGEPYGTLMGTTYERDADGNYLTDGGVYIPTDTVTSLGSVLADFTGGVSTTLRYKGFSLFALIDFQKGGRLFSLSNQWGMYSGTLAQTAENGIRENGIVVEGNEVLVDDATGDYILDANGNYQTNGVANTDTIGAQSHFFLNQGYIINEASVFDASYVKLREIRLTYTFPKSWFESAPIRDLSLSIVGRNLAILHRNIPNVDPEAALNSGNVQGFEGGQLPSERSIGVNLSVKF